MTDEQHHFANPGVTLPEYWKEAERCIQKATDAGLKFNGTVSTIWASDFRADEEGRRHHLYQSTGSISAPPTRARR